MSRFILAIDQGTTNTRAMIFDAQGKPIAKHEIELNQHFPELGWVEHEANEIWETTVSCCQRAAQAADISFKDIAAIGITNQRETTVVWDRKTGEPIYNAIVWQDGRTAEFCQSLKDAGHEASVREKTGLLLDPYFSASKIHWLLNNVPGAKEKANNGELAFGTIDSFLLWRLTKGQQHATDATNASRTLLFNIHNNSWDKELLDLFEIPEAILPTVFDNVHDFGSTDKDLFGHTIPITAMAGDQQAALFGEACFQPGMVKSTYGTGAFLMVNTGQTPIISKNQLLTTIGYRINGKTTYALEGSIFSAGVIVQWLRDNLGIIKDAEETEALAASLNDNASVYFVPAFTGLGAPYWSPDVRACIEGLTRDTGPVHIVRAGLEAIAYQTCDLLNAAKEDCGESLLNIRVDGGMSVNTWLMQFLADILQLPIERPVVNETTALGVAYLAGLKVGMFESLEAIEQLWQRDQHFDVQMDKNLRDDLYKGWQHAVGRVLFVDPIDK